MKISATFLLAIGLASCAAPKAEVVAEVPTNSALSQPEIAPISLVKSKPTLPVVHNTRIRLPDMLGLPQDEQLRSATGAPKDGKATVIARPPEE